MSNGQGGVVAATAEQAARSLDVHLSGLDTITSRVQSAYTYLKEYNRRTQGDEPPADKTPQVERANIGDLPYETQLSNWINDISSRLSDLEHEVERTLKF